MCIYMILIPLFSQWIKQNRKTRARFKFFYFNGDHI